MSMGGDEPATQTSMNTTVLRPEQQELLNLAMPGVRQFAASVPKRYDGSTVAGFDPSQTTGQNMALNAAGAQQGIVDNAANTSNFWTSGNVWDPANNPGLQQAIDTSNNTLIRNFNENTMPAVRQQAIQSGQQFGGSRRGVAEGIAARGLGDQIQSNTANLVNQNYNTNVEAQLKALGLVPNTSGAQTQPAMTTSGVGDVRQGQAQSLLSEQVSNFNYDQLAPFLQSKELLSLLNGIPIQGTEGVATGTNGSSGGDGLSKAIGTTMSVLPFLL